MNHKQKQARLNQFRANNLKKGMRMEAVDTATTLMMYLSLLVLRDKYGFGRKRLGDFIEHVSDLRSSMEDGYLTMDDIVDTIYAETGVKILIDKNNIF